MKRSSGCHHYLINQGLEMSACARALYPVWFGGEMGKKKKKSRRRHSAARLPRQRPECLGGARDGSGTRESLAGPRSWAESTGAHAGTSATLSALQYIIF